MSKSTIVITGMIGLLGALLTGAGEFILHFDPLARFTDNEFFKGISDRRSTVGHFFGVLGAPKFGDAAAWGERASKGIDVLVANAISGINAMPPRGACGSCSDDDIKAAIDYMIENSQ